MKASVPARGSSSLTVALFCMCVASVICWGILFRWFSVFEHYTNPFFSFDKLEGFFDSPYMRGATLLFAMITVLYALIYWLLSRVSRVTRGMKIGLITLIGGAGLINVGLHPIGAIDVFYYLTQFKLVFFYGENPYLVTFLPTYEADPYAQISGFLYWPLVYGPAWLLVTGVPSAVVGFDTVLAPLLAYKLVSLGFVLLGGLAIYLAAEDRRQGWLGAYLFVANPLVLFDGVANAHNDVVMAAFLIAAVAALRHKSALVLPFLAAAAMIKIFAVALLPALLVAILRQQWSIRKFAVSVVLMLAVFIGSIAPFWQGGAMIAGMQSAIEQQQTLLTASVGSLTREVLMEQGASEEALNLSRLLFMGLFGLLTLLIAYSVRQTERALAYTLLLLFLFVSSLFPWYIIPIVGLLALRPNSIRLTYIFAASGLALVSYTFSIWAWHNAALGPFNTRLIVGLHLTVPILLFLAWDVGRKRVRRAILAARVLRAQPLK